MLTSVSTPQRLRLGPYVPLGDALSLEERSLHQVAAAVYQPPWSRRAANYTHLRFCHPGWVQQAAHRSGGSCTWRVGAAWSCPHGVSCRASAGTLWLKATHLPHAAGSLPLGVVAQGGLPGCRGCSLLGSATEPSL